MNRERACQWIQEKERLSIPIPGKDLSHDQGAQLTVRADCWRAPRSNPSP